MITISQQKIRERSEQITDVLLSTIFATQTDLILDDIAQKNNLSQDQRYGVERLVQYVLLGFLPMKGLYEELEGLMPRSGGVTLSLYQQVDAKLFEPIHKDIEDNYLKFKAGVVDEASVQKPDVVSEVNLKTPQPEGTVNLKKEPEGPKILAMGTLGGGKDFTSPAPHPLAQPSQTSSFGPSIIQKKQDVESAAHPVRPPMPSPTDKDIFALSPKDRWGIESENIVTSRRMMGQSEVPPIAPAINRQPAHSPIPAAPQKVSGPTTIEKRDDIVPALEESRLPEIMPQVVHPVAGKPQTSEEKKSIAPPPSPVLPQRVASSAPVVPPPIPPISHPHEAVSNKSQAPEPSLTMRPVASVNINTVSQNVPGQESGASQQSVSSSPAFRPAPIQPLAEETTQSSGQPVFQARPMQWATPAQPPKQPDVVVEIRQTQASQAAPAGTYPNKPVENEPIPARPMKVSSPVQSVPPVVPTGSKEMLAAHPISPSRQEPGIKKPLDPNEVVDIGPVIIHKRDDPSVAQVRSGAQYRDLSSGGFSRNFSEQSPRPSAAPSVADIQVPAMPAGRTQTVDISVDTHDQSPVAGYGKPTVAPPPQKRGFFSFFKK